MTLSLSLQGAIHSQDSGARKPGQRSERETEVRPRQPRWKHEADEDVERLPTVNGMQDEKQWGWRGRYETGQWWS